MVSQVRYAVRILISGLEHAIKTLRRNCNFCFCLSLLLIVVGAGITILVSRSREYGSLTEVLKLGPSMVALGGTLFPIRVILNNRERIVYLQLLKTSLEGSRKLPEPYLNSLMEEAREALRKLGEREK